MPPAIGRAARIGPGWHPIDPDIGMHPSRFKHGASRIARLLFEEATDINFFAGMAVNPAHQDPKLPINFSIKMKLVDELAACLKQMGKKIKVSYF